MARHSTIEVLVLQKKNPSRLVQHTTRLTDFPVGFQIASVLFNVVQLQHPAGVLQSLSSDLAVLNLLGDHILLCNR